MHGFENLFSMLCSCSFLVILWSIYTNIKILFIDSCVIGAFRAQGGLVSLQRIKPVRAGGWERRGSGRAG